MWTADDIEAEDTEALVGLTEPQKRALERVDLARNMAHFTADTFAVRLRQQRQIEADNRNANDDNPVLAPRRPALRLVARGEET